MLVWINDVIETKTEIKNKLKNDVSLCCHSYIKVYTPVTDSEEITPQNIFGLVKKKRFKKSLSISWIFIEKIFMFL